MTLLIFRRYGRDGKGSAIVLWSLGLPKGLNLDNAQIEDLAQHFDIIAIMPGHQ